MMCGACDESGYSVWENNERKKLQCMWGRVMTEEELSAGEKCASLKVATGMLAVDGDESAMVEFVLRESA